MKNKHEKLQELRPPLGVREPLHKEARMPVAISGGQQGVPDIPIQLTEQRSNRGRATIMKSCIPLPPKGSRFSLLILLPTYDLCKQRQKALTIAARHSILAREAGEEMRKQVVLAKPFSLEDEKDSENTPPNLIQRILSLFKNVRPGSDLSNFQLPPQMNLPRSQLQCYGEIVYSFDGDDLLGECSRRDQPIERLKSVVTWYISTLRPLIFGMAPYNPVIGETHHVSNGHINVLVEQISHHPPVSALHATHEKENIDVMFCQYFTPKFRGAYVEVEVKGKRVMKLVNHNETYVMNQPKLLMTFLPAMGAHWAGKIVIKCPETRLEAELQLVSDSFLGRFRGTNKRAVKGKLFESSSKKQLYEIFGHWDRTVTAKNTKTGELEVIYKSCENIATLKTPIVKNLLEVRESESAMVWSEVSEGIMAKDWEKARDAKRDVEEKQRESLRKREAYGQSWIPKHFSVARSGKDSDCVPLQPIVPRAPIVVPL